MSNLTSIVIDHRNEDNQGEGFCITANQSSTLGDLEILNIEILMDHIFPFVGTNQFRNVASVNRRFRSIYTEIYTSRSTKVETVEYARLYLDETYYKVPVVKIRRYMKPIFLSLAAEHGDVELVHLFNRVRSRVQLREKEVTAQAALIGNLEGLQNFRAHGFQWDTYTSSNAALNGHLHVLVYAYENGCKWNEYTCSFAAKNGHLYILQYARMNGCPWNVYTTDFARQNNHNDVLIWARDQGCPEWNFL